MEGDNVGLQCGSPEARVRGIVVSLDATEEIVAEAKRKGANMIITHHPLLFRPLRSLTFGHPTGRCVAALIRNRIHLYAAHTNLDFTEGGTSFALAAILGLVDVSFLHQPYQEERKIVTFVPADQVEKVSGAMAEAGAGLIGNYEHCSFRAAGTGTFRGNAAAKPAVGRRETPERVAEIRLEMVVPRTSVDAVVRALIKAHPYEEVAYDIYPLENKTKRYGMGVIGNLRRPVRLEGFLKVVKRALGARMVRWTGDSRRMIRRVAACGGSGSRLISEAIRQKADAFVTADVKYHSFQEPGTAMALIDAGHFETEYPVIGAVVGRIREELQRRDERIPVYAAATRTNPVYYV